MCKQSSSALDVTGHLRKALRDGGNLFCCFTNSYASSAAIPRSGAEGRRSLRLGGSGRGSYWLILTYSDRQEDSCTYRGTGIPTSRQTVPTLPGCLTGFLEPLSLTSAAVSPLSLLLLVSLLSHHLLHLLLLLLFSPPPPPPPLCSNPSLHAFLLQQCCLYLHFFFPPHNRPFCFFFFFKLLPKMKATSGLRTITSYLMKTFKFIAHT